MHDKLRHRFILHLNEKSNICLDKTSWEGPKIYMLETRAGVITRSYLPPRYYAIFDDVSGVPEVAVAPFIIADVKSAKRSHP